ncbi:MULTISPECIES: sacsin N-terminal ATP-binding-like domain-containing protein [unclassified Thiocapsa]|uniref:sacsin N-terminal ATP-binding-like domain-containing protein n=1 Tax=unclassified Thiocapsa TaxID=2641286 RepID=UPI0035AE0A5C
MEVCRNRLKERREYAKRPILELLQNVEDALSDDERQGGVVIRIDDGNLIIANEGAPFTDRGFRALCTLNDSAKQAETDRERPPRMIGSKGTGFKSVLNWTDRIELFSGSIAACFDRAEAAPLIRQTIGKAGVAKIEEDGPWPDDRSSRGASGAMSKPKRSNGSNRWFTDVLIMADSDAFGSRHWSAARGSVRRGLPRSNGPSVDPTVFRPRGAARLCITTGACPAGGSRGAAFARIGDGDAGFSGDSTAWRSSLRATTGPWRCFISVESMRRWPVSWPLGRRIRTTCSPSAGLCACVCIGATRWGRRV